MPLPTFEGLSRCRCLPLWKSISNHPHSFQFSDAFTFTESGLNPQKIVPFVNEFAMNVLITGHNTTTALPTILSTSSTGHYTGIIHLKPTATGIVAERFEWLHHTKRPNGARLPIQCPQCRSCRPWDIPSRRPKKYNKILTFQCGTKKCSGVCRITPLKGYKMFVSESTVGEWFSRVL